MTAMIIQLPNSCSDGNARQSLQAELRRARIRIAQLETSLEEAMRDNLANYNRAREAERLLDQMGNQPSDKATGI